MDFDWKSVVKTVAPMIGTAVGGPFGGMAAKFVSDAVLGDGEAFDEKKITAALQSGDPEVFAKLKAADQNFKVKMKALDIKEEDLHAKDRDSARKMQVAAKSFVVPILATITVGGFFGVIGYVLKGEVPMDSTVTGMVIGAVGSKAEQVYNFYFGSSAGSKDKTLHMANKGGQ